MEDKPTPVLDNSFNVNTLFNSGLDQKFLPLIKLEKLPMKPSPKMVKTPTILIEKKIDLLMMSPEKQSKIMKHLNKKKLKNRTHKSKDRLRIKMHSYPKLNKENLCRTSKSKVSKNKKKKKKNSKTEDKNMKLETFCSSDEDLDNFILESNRQSSLAYENLFNEVHSSLLPLQSEVAQNVNTEKSLNINENTNLKTVSPKLRLFTPQKSHKSSILTPPSNKNFKKITTPSEKFYGSKSPKLVLNSTPPRLPKDSFVFQEASMHDCNNSSNKSHSDKSAKEKLTKKSNKTPKPSKKNLSTKKALDKPNRAKKKDPSLKNKKSTLDTLDEDETESLNIPRPKTRGSTVLSNNPSTYFMTSLPQHYEHIDVKQFDGYLHVTICPKSSGVNSLEWDDISVCSDVDMATYSPPSYNCLNGNVLEEFCSVLENSNYDNNKAVLITSVGKNFSFGLDLQNIVYHMNFNNKNKLSQIADTLNKFVSALISFPKPIFVAVQGRAIGLGASMLMLCDLVFASERATLELPYTLQGLSPNGCSSYTLPSTIGQNKANCFFYGKKVLGANQALQDGLFSEVFAHATLMKNVIPKVREICGSSLSALMATKKLTRAHQMVRLNYTNSTETTALKRCLFANETKKVIQQYVDKYQDV